MRQRQRELSILEAELRTKHKLIHLLVDHISEIKDMSDIGDINDRCNEVLDDKKFWEYQ